MGKPQYVMRPARSARGVFARGHDKNLPLANLSSRQRSWTDYPNIAERRDPLKILVGYGPRGRSNDAGRLEQNWTDPNEPVNSTGMVCCANPICGCYCSFTGITSKRKSTRAVVAEIPDDAYATMVKHLFVTTVASFSSMQGITEKAAVAAAQIRQDAFTELCAAVKDLPTGTVVRINKDRDGIHYDLVYDL
jgi:hypothetical protein